MKSNKEQKTVAKLQKIWIDLDNSPHVPFFYPIIKELKNLNYDVIVTIRDCAQTCELADLFKMNYRRIGKHHGKNLALKVGGTILRAIKLSKIMISNWPNIALSHGSRAQMLSAILLGIPSLEITDYEHADGFIHPKWIMMPEVLNGDSRVPNDHVLKYPGIKEDVYVPNFNPDPTILKILGVNGSNLLVTIRPPATEAHYHNPEAEALFTEAVNYLGSINDLKMVILPRYDAQRVTIAKEWPEWHSKRKIIIPEQVVDGLNLLWHSDFAISGGGTMNREAAALGLPVYSIFRGKIGAVDRFLAKSGRLTLLESVADVRAKIKVEKRTLPSGPPESNTRTLNAVVDNIIHALNSK
jgi:uncharacterized protein